MDQTRKNTRSTKTHNTTETPPDDTDDTNDIPTQEPHNTTAHAMYVTMEEPGRVYTDQTGRFPVTSSRGHQYVMVMYDYDSNSILTEPLKNRTAPAIL